MEGTVKLNGEEIAEIIGKRFNVKNVEVLDVQTSEPASEVTITVKLG